MPRHRPRCSYSAPCDTRRSVAPRTTPWSTPHDQFLKQGRIHVVRTSIQVVQRTQRQVIYSPPPASPEQQFSSCYQRKQLAVLIVIRRRLTAQGNGQATLDREGTRALLQEAGSPRSGSERAASAGGAVTRPGSETPRQIRA